MLQTLAIPLVLGTYLGTGAGFLYKFTQALFGEKTQRSNNMLISTLSYGACLATYNLLPLVLK